MAEYLGWPAIAKRLGVSIPTARRWHSDLGLLVYRRCLPRGQQRWCWYINDNLILAWEVSRARVDRSASLEERAQRGAVATVSPGAAGDR